MIKAKHRNYFINEKIVKNVFTQNERYFARLISGEIIEIDELDYCNLGGELAHG